MTTQKIAITILVVLVIILAWLWMDARNDLNNVLANLEKDTTDYKAEIAEKCNPLTLKDPGKSAECSTALQKFSDALAKYRVEVKDANEEAAAE